MKNARISYRLIVERYWVGFLAISTTRFPYDLIVYPVGLRHSPHFWYDTIFSLFPQFGV